MSCQILPKAKTAHPQTGKYLHLGFRPHADHAQKLKAIKAAWAKRGVKRSTSALINFCLGKGLPVLERQAREE